MNIEIQTAQIPNKETHTFSFTKPINRYIIGFSKLSLKFSKSSHHIKEISIDLTNSEVKGNEITITPQLRMKDSSDHKESSKSTIEIIVMATVNNGNSEIRMHSNVKTDQRNELPLINIKPTFIKSTLIFSTSKYSKSDHHLHSYFSKISPVIDSNFFVLKGQSVIQDQNYHYGNGTVAGSVIIYYGQDKNVLCTDFDSKKIDKDSDEQTVCFGDVDKEFNCDDYQLACFVNNFLLSFENNDHHVYELEISALLNDNKMFVKDGKAFAKVALKSFLADEGHHRINIPQNNIAGFIIAINKNCSN